MDEESVWGHAAQCCKGRAGLVTRSRGTDIAVKCRVFNKLTCLALTAAAAEVNGLSRHFCRIVKKRRPQCRSFAITGFPVEPSPGPVRWLMRVAAASVDKNVCC